MGLLRSFGAAATALAIVLSNQTICLASALNHNGFFHTKNGFNLAGHHRLPAAPNPGVNVKTFGATGNGTTDDTAAIQNAISFAASSHQAVFFPAGTYLHNNFITANGVSLIGSGGATTLLAGDSNNSAVILTGNSPSIQNLIVSTINFTVGGPLTPANSNVLVQNAQNFTVQNITAVEGVGRSGVFVTLSDNEIGRAHV